MIGGAIDFRVIGENWDETLRLAASIKAGTVAPSILMRRLAAYPKQNALAKTLREIGRLERTLFTLDWISDPTLRRRSNAGLNKGEAHHALKRAVFFTASAKSETGPSKTSAIAPPVSISPSQPSSYGTPSISAVRSVNCVLVAKSSPTSFFPTSRRSAGSTSPSTAITYGQRSPLKTPSARYETRAPPASKPLSMRFVEDSTMMGWTAPRAASSCQDGRYRSTI